MNKSLVILAAVFVVPIMKSPGDPVSGTSLNIYSGYPGSSIASGSGSIGIGNYLNAAHSLAIGQYHEINATGSLAVGENDELRIAYSLAVGNGNMSSGSVSGGNSLAVGNANFSSSSGITLQNSAVIGTYTAGYTYSSGSLSNSLAVGEANSVAVTDGLVVGKNNAASGQHYVIGEGLVADTNPLMVVLGKYNTSPTTGQLFVIGNGTATTRSNALDVQGDGKMRLFATAASTPSIVLDPNIPQITINGQPVAAASTSGYFGFGTATPTEKMDVVGNQKLSGYLKFPSAYGNGDSGKIVSGAFGAGLNFVGANTDNTYRKLRLWGEITQSENGGTNTWAGTNYFSGNVGIGTAAPAARFTVGPVAGYQTPPAPTAMIGQSIVDWEYQQGYDGSTYYTKLADVGANNGAVQIEGLLGAHTAGGGKAAINLLVSARNAEIHTGSVLGDIGYASDIKVFKNGDNSLSVYLVTSAWAEINLRITGISDSVTLYPSPVRATTVPNGTLAYTLSQNAQYTLHNDGTIHIAKSQGDISMGEFAP